jgi:hypothetical protein
MLALARVTTQTTDRGVTQKTYAAGGFTVFVTLVGALGSFGNFLVNLGVHYHWWGLT